MIDGADTAWLLISSTLVLRDLRSVFSTPAWSSEIARYILIQCIALTALVSLLWYAGAYSEAFSGHGALIGDMNSAMLAHLSRSAVHPGTHIPESVFVMFQMTFAVITPALMIGAYAERMRFGSVLLFSGLWLVVVYAPVTHWVWGGGWLAARGVMDFAGGIVVHVTAGVSALTIAWILGPREGYPSALRPPHAPWMVMVGASLLWVGWFGFNAGSALASGGDAGMTMLATQLSAATATLTWIVIERVNFGKSSLVGAVTGSVAGLAAITPASGYVGPTAAIVIGFVASLVCGAVLIVKRRLRVDDALDVLGVHGVGGALGTLLLPFLVSLGAGGVSLSRPASAQFLVQLEGVASVAAWSALATFLIVKLTALAIRLRVDHKAEIQGLDFALHGETAYNID